MGGAGGDADADALEGVELGLGRAAMLGFLGTTVGDALTRGDGPIEQLTLESSYVARHVNPMELARDALELGGFYVESVVLVWLVLGSALLLGFSQGLRNPIRTVSGRHAGQRAQAAFSEIERRTKLTFEDKNRTSFSTGDWPCSGRCSRSSATWKPAAWGRSNKSTKNSAFQSSTKRSSPFFSSPV